MGSECACRVVSHNEQAPCFSVGKGHEILYCPRHAEAHVAALEARLTWALRCVEAAKNVLLVSSQETRTRLNGEKWEYVGTSLMEIKQLQDALAAEPPQEAG